MYVVVFLCDAKKHIVVPQKFIFALSQQYLNNYGRQRTRKFLVFWSNKAFFCDEIPDLNYKPNFSLNVSSTYPPDGRDEACYIGQIKYFFGKYNPLSDVPIVANVLIVGELYTNCSLNF